LSKFHQKYIQNFKNKLYNFITINIHSQGYSRQFIIKSFQKVVLSNNLSFLTYSFHKGSLLAAKAYNNFVKSCSPNKHPLSY
jgi:hypothetical protein